MILTIDKITVHSLGKMSVCHYAKNTVRRFWPNFQPIFEEIFWILQTSRNFRFLSFSHFFFKKWSVFRRVNFF